MTTSRIIAIADAVVDALNEASGPVLSMSFVAQRTYVPLGDLKDMTDLHLKVVPMTSTTEIVSRSDSQEDYEIDIGIQQKVDSASLDGVDPLMGFVQEVVDFWTRKALSVTTGNGDSKRSFGVYCVSVSNRPVYSTEHLQQMVLFVSLVKLTFRMMA
jgi:hypothetical protein